MNKMSPLKKSLIISASILVIVLIGLLGFNYYYSSLDNELNVPPNLPPSTGFYEGALIDKEYGFFEYEGTDESRFIAPQYANYRTLKKGVNYLYPKIDQTVGQIINEDIKPVAGLKVLFAYYSSNPTKYNTNDCFIVFPNGPYSSTCPIPFNEIYDFTVKRNEAFIIISNMDFDYNYSVLADSNTLASDFDFQPPTDEEGWVLKPLSQNVDLYDPRIEAVWLQSGANSFEQIGDFKNIEVTRPYKLAWIKFGKSTDQYINR